MTTAKIVPSGESGDGFSEMKGRDLMSVQEVSAEELAALYHHYHQALGPDFGGTTAPSPQSWDELPQQEKARVVAATRLALLEIASTVKERKDTRGYFAKPGEAEWGC